MSVLCKISHKLRWESYGRALANPFPDAERTDLRNWFMAPDSAHWYALLTRYRAEKRAKTELVKRGFETFAPALEEVHRWSDRSKRVDVPLFSGYLFVYTTLTREARTSVLQTPGVARFVAFGNDVASVPSRQIEDLQKLLQSNIPCSLHAFLQVGRRVRIRGGCLNGMEGILEQNSDKKLVISIESIQRSVAVQIEGYELELA